MFKRLLVHLRIAFLVEEHIVSPYSLIEMRKRFELRPAPCGFHGRFNIWINLETSRAHRRQHSSPRLCHQPQLFQSADTLLIQLCPRAVFLSGSKPLHSFAFNHFMCTVDPPETQCFFHGIKVIEPVIFGWPAALQLHPTLAFAVSIERKPFTEIRSIIDL